MTKQTLPLIERSDYKISVTVHAPDGITHKHFIEIETVVYDEYNKAWLDSRKTKLFLDDLEILALGNFLSEKSLYYPDTKGEDQ